MSMKKIIRIIQKKDRAVQAVFSMLNLQRCFFCAVLFAFFTPVVLFLLSFGAFSESVKPFAIPGIFFTIFSAAFAYLEFYIMRIRAKHYYVQVTYGYIACLLCFLAFFTGVSYQNGGGLGFYYIAVCLCAFVLYTSPVEYAALCVFELFLLLTVSVFSGEQTFRMSQLLLTAVVHLFAFFLSRERFRARIDVIAKEQQLRREAWQARFDPLTGILNRRGLEQEMKAVWESCVKNGDTVAVMMVDIDYFKEYNENYGHVEGDYCIRRVARLLRSVVGNKGRVAHIGSGEFVIFLRKLHGEGIMELAERLRSEVEALHIKQAGERGEVLTVSIGVDIEEADGDLTFVGLYGRADRQLYRAKKSGRNRVCGNRSFRTVSVPRKRERIG